MSSELSSLRATPVPLESATLSRFLRVESEDEGGAAQLASVHDALWDLKQALALQCVFTVGCCHRARTATVGSRASDGFRGGSDDAATAGSSVIIGIIGGGVIGGVVAHALLDAGIPPTAILMSTRSPRRQSELAARGVAVFFDNALVASRAHVLLVAVLPCQMAELARTLRPPAHAVVLSLAGAVPLAKVRSLFGAPSALTSGADTTLPLLQSAQAERREDQELLLGGAAPPESGVVSTGRLPDEEVLELAARGFFADAGCVARLVEALRVMLSDFELPTALVSSAALEAVFGAQSGEALSALAVELETVGTQPPSEPPHSVSGHELIAMREKSAQASEAVQCARAAFLRRIRGE